MWSEELGLRVLKRPQALRFDFHLAHSLRSSLFLDHSLFSALSLNQFALKQSQEQRGSLRKSYLRLLSPCQRRDKRFVAALVPICAL